MMLSTNRRLNIRNLLPEFSAEVGRHVMLHQEGRGAEAAVTEDALELTSPPGVGDGRSAGLCPLTLLALGRPSALRGQTGWVKADLPVGVIIFAGNTGEERRDKLIIELKPTLKRV